ncbi:MAG: thioredoxin family protein [Lentisphaeria bacterium]|nr:thioredoxin family protein [Lentisphaeria bacterium]
MKKISGLLVYILFLLPFILSGEEKLFDWNGKIDGNKIIVTANIQPFSYLYKDFTSIKITPSDGVKLLTEPGSVKYKDESGEVSIYKGGSVFVWEYSIKESKSKNWKIDISFQGCKMNQNGSGGVCLMPEDKSIILSFDGNVKSMNDGKKSVKNKIDGKLPSYTITSISEGYKNKKEFLSFLKGEKKDKGFFDSLEGRNIFILLLIVFFGGFALNLTPCVLPMIPVNLAIIGAGKKTDRSRKEKILRGCVYAFGITLAYGILGMVVVLTGSSFGAVDSHWLFQALVALVFFILALSMFDVFILDISRFRSNFKMPSAAGLTGIFFLGVIAALLAGACVAPVVAAALLESSRMYNSGNPFGLLLLFVLGAGMAMPWPIAAAGFAVLPKPGKWMKFIKYLFGIIILILAFNSAYLSFTLFRSHYAEHKENKKEHTEKLYKAVKESSSTGKKVLIDFWASWCKNCLEMDRSVLTNPAVKKEMENYIFVKFDATNMQSEEVKKVLKEFHIKGLPSFVILQGD